MLLKDIGEFGLIRRIASALPPAPEHVVVGVGDDVAVLEGLDGNYLLATIDAQVEGVHFRLDTTTAYQLGRKATVINMSDVAAMGGTPLWALVSLALPTHVEVSFVDELYRGMNEEIQRGGGCIVGGNVSRGHAGILVDICLLGSVAKDRVILRRGAKEGDAIMVTGTLGDSKAGLELLSRSNWSVSPESRERVLERHLTPRARLEEGRMLAGLKKVSAMLDVSDGFLGDLQHLCEASGVGARVWAHEILVSDACREVAGLAGVNPLEWALTGGEDYELLFTISQEYVNDAVAAVEGVAGTPCRRVGVIGPRGEGIQLSTSDGSVLPVAGFVKGWDHFSELNQSTEKRRK